MCDEEEEEDSGREKADMLPANLAFRHFVPQN